MAWERVESAEDFTKEGEELEVKLIGVDEKTGKLKLSRKALLPKPEGYVERPPRGDRPPRRDGGRRDDNRHGGDRRDGYRRDNDRRDNDRRDNRRPRRDN